MVLVLAAPDKFKGTASATEIAVAIARGATSAGALCDQVPMADGGEGFLEAMGGANRHSTVTGPLGGRVDAAWRLARGEAVIEMAAASGLALAGGPDDNDPIAASTIGTGELISAAVNAGATRVLLGVGGSATTDGGLGALRALYPLQRLRGVDLVVACDVRTRFVDAAPLFAPQKGATPAQVELLRRRLERLAQIYRDEHGVDVADLEGSGAAGGLAGALAAVGAELVSGFEVVADAVELLDRIERADLVITGEGSVDAESFEGKVVGGVVAFAEEAGVPVMTVAGEFFDGVDRRAEVVARTEIVSLTERFGRDASMADPAACVELVVADRLASSNGSRRGRLNDA